MDIVHLALVVAVLSSQGIRLLTSAETGTIGQLGLAMRDITELTGQYPKPDKQIIHYFYQLAIKTYNAYKKGYLEPQDDSEGEYKIEGIHGLKVMTYKVLKRDLDDDDDWDLSLPSIWIYETAKKYIAEHYPPSQDEPRSHNKDPGLASKQDFDNFLNKRKPYQGEVIDETGSPEETGCFGNCMRRLFGS